MRSIGFAHRVPVPAVVVGLVLALAGGAPAVAWEVDGTAPGSELEGFHERFSLAAYPYPRHSAKPLGTLGFDVYVEGAATPDFEQDVRGAVDGDLPGGYLGIYRVGARKGLPGGVDVGASWGRVVDSDIDLLSGEVSWAILDGGVATPALGLRGTFTRSTGSDVYELTQAGVEAEVSKGFAVLTPYAGAGFVWSEGDFERSGLPFFGPRSFDSTKGVVYGGVILNLLVPKIAFEVSRGYEFQGAVRISFGL